MTKTDAKMQATAILTDVEKRRLSWRCRRGLLELDIVLQRFYEHHLAGLNAEELIAFDSLLDYPDNEFLDVITTRVVVSTTGVSNTAAMQQVLEKIRNS